MEHVQFIDDLCLFMMIYLLNAVIFHSHIYLDPPRTKNGTFRIFPWLLGKQLDIEFSGGSRNIPHDFRIRVSKSSFRGYYPSYQWIR